MKRIMMILLALTIMSGVAMAEPASMHCPNVYHETLAAGATAYTERVELNKNEGFFSFQAIYTGTGVLQVSYELSNDGTNWSTAVEIVASATTDVVYPYPAAGVNIFAKYQRLKFVETGSANNCVISGVFRCIQ